MRFKVFRTTRVVLLSAGLVLAATLVASPAGTLAGGGQASSCADPTPVRYLPEESAATAAITDPGILRALASDQSQLAPMSPADRAAAAAGVTASAKKMAAIRARRFTFAANVAHFASRSEAISACSGAMSSGAAAQLGRVARALAPGAYACASNVSCSSSGVAWIESLNHQDEGGSGTWCGPATVSMIALTEPGPSYVTQQTVRDYISNLQGPGRTVEEVGSDDSSVLAALGKYVTGPNLGSTNWYAFVALMNGPTPPTAQERSDYHGRLADDINVFGYAVAGNTVEFAGASNPHLPGHPTTGPTIYHYIEIGGYDETDHTDYFADSATGVPTWGANVPAYSWYSEYNLMTLMGGRGYIW
jgi:hypothetical protein